MSLLSRRVALAHGQLLRSRGGAGIFVPSGGQDVVSIYDRSYVTMDNLIIDASNISSVGVRIGGDGPAYAHFVTLQNSTVRNSPHICITEQGSRRSQFQLLLLTWTYIPVAVRILIMVFTLQLETA